MVQRPVDGRMNRRAESDDEGGAAPSQRGLHLVEEKVHRLDLDEVKTHRPTRAAAQRANASIQQQICDTAYLSGARPFPPVQAYSDPVYESNLDKLKLSNDYAHHIVVDNYHHDYSYVYANNYPQSDQFYQVTTLLLLNFYNYFLIIFWKIHFLIA